MRSFEVQYWVQKRWLLGCTSIFYYNLMEMTLTSSAYIFKMLVLADYMIYEGIFFVFSCNANNWMICLVLWHVMMSETHACVLSSHSLEVCSIFLSMLVFKNHDFFRRFLSTKANKSRSKSLLLHGIEPEATRSEV